MEPKLCIEQNWIDFADTLIRLRDVDYFKFDRDNEKIICHYHHGQSFETLIEDYEDEEAIEVYNSRVSHLKSLLGLT